MTELEHRAVSLVGDAEHAYGDTVHVRVLGPVAALQDGVDLPLGGPKQRAAFALLAARVGQVVSVDELIDGLWGDEPTPGARSTLQTYISNLRAAIGDIIAHDGGGYRLDIDPGRVDAVQFEQVVERARALVESDPPHAAQQLRAALALWRGHPYANVSGSLPLELEAGRLEELRLGAVEGRVEAELAMGHHAELVAELEVLCAEFPLREGFRAQHMLALYRCGRQAEALRAFQKTRTYFAEELGLDPSARLRELERQILSQDESLLLELGPQVETLAFLLTDIEDSTVLWETQTAGMRPAVAQHDRVIRDAVEAAGGRIVKRVGDGIDTVFADVGAAVAAAEEIQRGLAALDWGDTGPLLVRMAIDVGEVEARGGDYFGPVLNRAGRILAAGHGAQVLLSADAHAALAATASGWQAKALGEFRFKGIGTPVNVFQLLLEGLPAEFPPLRIDRLPPLLPAVAFGRSVRGYELREEVGRGDFGIVYRAYQPSVGREVAIKIIRPELVNQPTFIRRFEAEARLIAQLEHPHIVSLYDYWRDPEGAYLVMRWLRGGSLRQALERGPWNVDAAARLLVQVAGALSYAHRQGVVHGDLKPANVLLDEDGHAYLSDFGIAARLSDPSEHGRVVTSSPAYVAPEELAGEPLGPRSDLYSLGLLSFELLTGRRPPMDRALPALGSLRPELPAVLDGMIAKATAAETADRYESVEAYLVAVMSALGEVPRAVGEPYTPAENPYKGLRAFEETDADVFFGRDSLVAELVAEVAERRLVAVVGPSGIGKSSAVKAGMIPALRSGTVPGSRSWVVSDMFPGAYPFEELAAALLRVAIARPADIVEELGRDELGMTRVVKRVLSPDSELLLIVDQFEELFTLTSDEEERNRFLQGLVRLVTDGRSRARVVVTLRADFLDHPLRYPELGELVRAGMVVVAAPSDDELAAAIEGPAARTGVRFEPGLVSEVIADVRDQPGALPLLQYALTELFAARTSDMLTLKGYRATGGVVGALGRRAEDLFARLDGRGQTAARQVFLRLVAVDATGQDTRRRVRRRELRHLELEPAILDELLERYGEHRLLTFDREPLTRSPTVEIAHEALLDQWDRLRSWVNERREDLLLHRRLFEAVEEWEGTGRQMDYLPRAGRLAQFESWAAATDITLNAEEREFLGKSRRHEDERGRRVARRRRGILAGFGLAAIVAALLAVLAFVSRERATEKEQLATARELAASAIAVLERDPELSLLLSIQAAEIAEPTYETVSALHQALLAHRTLWTVQWPPEPQVDGPAPPFWGSLSPDGGLLLIGGMNRLEVRDVERRERLWQVELAEGAWAFARFTSEGSQVVGSVSWDLASSEDPPPGVTPGILLWDATTGEEAGRLGVGRCPLVGAPDSGAGTMFQHGPYVDLSHPLGIVVPRLRGEGQGGRRCDPETLAVTLLDLGTGERRHIAEIGREDGVEASTSAEARYVAVSSLGRTRIVDAIGGRVVFDRQLADASEARLSADGSELVTGGGSFGDPLTLWNVRTGERLRTFDSGGAQAVGVDFSDDGQTLVSTLSVDGIVRLWDVASGRERLSLPGHTSGIRWTSLSRDASRLASVSIDGSIRVWILEPRGELGAFQLGAGAWSAGGLDLAGDRAAAFRPITGSSAEAVVFDPSLGEIEGEIASITGQLLRLSPDGTRLAAQQLIAEGKFGPVRIHDLETGAITTMRGLCVHSGGGGDPGCREAPATPFAEWAVDLAFSPDGSMLAVGGFISGVSVWDSSSGELLFNSGRLSELCCAIDFSPDASRLVASAGEDIVVFDTADWRAVTRRTLDEGWLRRFRFSHDGRYLIGGSQAARVVIVDTETWRPMASLAGHQGFIKDVDVSPGDTLIASSDSFGLVRIWALPSGEPQQGIPFQTQIQNVEFIDDRHLFMTPDEGPAVLIMTVDVEELLEIARSRVTRGLTREECRTYLHLDTCPSA